jgi:hypothetical protein
VRITPGATLAAKTQFRSKIEQNSVAISGSHGRRLSKLFCFKRVVFPGGRSDWELRTEIFSTKIGEALAVSRRLRLRLEERNLRIQLGWRAVASTPLVPGNAIWCSEPGVHLACQDTVQSQRKYRNEWTEWIAQTTCSIGTDFSGLGPPLCGAEQQSFVARRCDLLRGRGPSLRVLPALALLSVPGPAMPAAGLHQSVGA